MKRILLVLNKTNREMPAMAAIRNRIQALDPHSVTKIIPFDGNFMRDAAAFRPEVILMFPMGSIGVSRLVYLLKLRFGCRVVCFRSEGILDPQSPQSISNHIGFDRFGTKLVDAEIFWGPGPAELIGGALIGQKKLSSAERIRYFGYPRLERYFRDSGVERLALLSEAILAKLQQYRRDQVVLVITGFHFANYSSADLFGSGDLDAENRYEELLTIVDRVKRYREEWKDAVRKSARAHSDLLFVVKKHPNEGRADYLDLEPEPNVIFIADDVDFGDILERSGLLVHYGSTAAAEAYIARIPTVYACSADPVLQDWFPRMGWPSSLSILIGNLESAIQKFIAGELSGEASREIDRVLEWNFNVRPGVEYRPSQDIAAFLLADERGQRIPWWDKFMWRSLWWYVGVKARQFVSRYVAHPSPKSA